MVPSVSLPFFQSLTLGNSSLTCSGSFLSLLVAIILVRDLRNHSSLLTTASSSTPTLHIAISICPIKPPRVSCGQERILLVLSFKAPHCPNNVHSFHLHLTFPPAHQPPSFHLSKSYPSFTSMKSWPPAPQLLHLMPQAFPHCDELCVHSPTSF